MLWHDSLKDLFSSEVSLDNLLKVDNAVSHAAPSLSSINYDNSDGDNDEDSICLLEGVEPDSPSESQSLKHLGHFSFPITPRQRTLLLAGEPFLISKKDSRNRPTRCSSFDDAMASQTSTPRRGRRRPARACSMDDLKKWTEATPASSQINARMPVRTIPDECQTGGDRTIYATELLKPMRRLSNGSLGWIQIAILSYR